MAHGPIDKNKLALEKRDRARRANGWQKVYGKTQTRHC